jgi:pimeloyl-ACP methyl ester carboxylesterase
MSPWITRRELVRRLFGIGPAMLLVPESLHALGSPSVATGRSGDPARASNLDPLPPEVLPNGVRSRFVENVNGLRMHVLEAGFESAGRPAVLLLHGFPELAYSWRRVMPLLADSGYHVIAPDQRGYGRTTGWDPDYDGDLAPFRRLNIVRDALGLVHAFGYRSVAGVVGHDFGSPIAAWCGIVRPDVFRTVALMSVPFSGSPTIPFDTANRPPHEAGPAGPDLAAQLAALPRPRKNYQDHFRTRAANEDFSNPPQGLHDFLRGYHHFKSGDWPGNRPFRLSSRTAEEMARMPTYYIMDLASTMAETVAEHMPTPAQIEANTWLPDPELAVYVGEFGRTGFQGGLNWYRSGGIGTAEQQLFAGRTLDQPSVYISGSADWGSYQNPGALERMESEACTNFHGIHMVEGAGHWVQQERPEATARLLMEFLRSV